MPLLLLPTWSSHHPTLLCIVGKRLQRLLVSAFLGTSKLCLNTDRLDAVYWKPTCAMRKYWFLQGVSFD